MKTKNTNLLAEAGRESSETLSLEKSLPMLDLILEAREDIEALSAQISLKIMHRCMDQEIHGRKNDKRPSARRESSSTRVTYSGWRRERG